MYRIVEIRRNRYALQEMPREVHEGGVQGSNRKEEARLSVPVVQRGIDMRYAVYVKSPYNHTPGVKDVVDDEIVARGLVEKYNAAGAKHGYTSFYKPIEEKPEDKNKSIWQLREEGII